MTDGKGATQPKTAPNHHKTNTDKDAGKRHFTSGDGAGEDIQHRQAGSGDDRIDAVELTRRLGFTAGEYISLSWKRPGDAPWRYRVVGYEPHRLANYIAMAGAGVNHYFLINPVRSDTAKRGRADEITRLADLPVEIDGYKNGHATVETVCGFAIELSQKIGEAPVGIVESGGGWHIHWAVAGGEIGGGPAWWPETTASRWTRSSTWPGCCACRGRSTPSTAPRARSSPTTCREDRLRCPSCAGPCTSTYPHPRHRGHRGHGVW